MMGDGLHHEEPWIEVEYGRILRKLYPEIGQEKRKKKAEAVDANMVILLEGFKCSCGGKLKQSRRGSKVCYCIECNKRHMATKSKKK